MKKLIQLLILIVFLNSCTSTKNYSAKKDIDKTFQDALLQLNRNANNETARKALYGLYGDVQHLHLSNIKKFIAENKDASPHWNDIIIEYQSLQNAYNLIMNSDIALTVIKPRNYDINLWETREAAAKHYYQLAESILHDDGRQNARKALAYLKICNYYSPGYENVKSETGIAYERAVIKIVIDSLDDNVNTYPITDSDWSISGYNLSNQFFRKKLIIDLKNDFLNSEYPIAFYTQNEAEKNNIKPDLLLSLKLKDVTLYYPTSSILGPPAIYNVKTLRYAGSAYAKISINIKDIDKDKTISKKILKEDCKWSHNIDQGKDLLDLLQKIYAKIYPQIKDNITIALN